MRLAIIDLGTNSVRFDVVQIGPGGQVDKLHREKLMIRLGEHVFLRRRLDLHSIGVCLDAFRSFARTIKDFRVTRVVAFGTSALREAKDGERLIQKIRKNTGISVRIISGDEEARLIAKGVLKNESSLRGRYALVDIGGGSTEVTICSGRKILRSGSFALGTARLQQVFLKTIPPDVSASDKGSSVDLLRRHIRGILLYRLVSEEWPKVSRIIGSSGTIRALCRISKRETGSPIIEKTYLDDLVRRMTKMTREELGRIRGMESRRIDMILSGAILLQECMNSVHAKHAQSTEFSLRDGILDEQIEHLRAANSETSFNIVSEVFRVAKRLGGEDAELKQSVRIAEAVFDELKSVHGLKPEWKVYLIMAELLCETGRAISSIHFEKHSAYIADHLDADCLGEWERKMLSELCLHHRNGRVLKKEAPFKKNPVLRRAFYKLLALLRISVAFSLQRSKPIKVEKVTIKGKQVKVSVSKRYAPDLETLRADQTRQLFEETFKKQLSLELV